MRSQAIGLSPASRSRPREELDALVVHGIETAREHRLEELFLGPEVIVDRREVHAGRRRELPEAGGLEAVLHEEVLGDVEDARLGVLGGRVERWGPAGGTGRRHRDLEQPIQTSV
jgi:hypothetical protein